MFSSPLARFLAKTNIHYGWAMMVLVLAWHLLVGHARHSRHLQSTRSRIMIAGSLRPAANDE